MFADDDWDDWNRPGNDPWSMPPPQFGGDFDRRSSYERNNYERNSLDNQRYDRTPGGDWASQGWREPAPESPYRDDDPWGDR